MKYLIFLIVLVASGCRDSNTTTEDVLPPVTRSGNNTFGLSINGKVYTPKSSKNDVSNIGYPMYNGVAVLNTNNSKFIALVSLEKTNETNISFYIDDPEGIATKEYILNRQGQYNTSGPVTIDYTDRYGPNQKEYVTISNSGSIIITRNDDNVISGTFSGKLMPIGQGNSTEIIEITDGRFDFNKSTINDHVFP